MKPSNDNLATFITQEKQIFETYYPDLNWNDNHWPTHLICPDWKRSKTISLNFSPIKRGGIKLEGFNNPPSKYQFNQDHVEALKSIIFYLKRTRQLKANAVTTYVLIAKAILHFMYDSKIERFNEVNISIMNRVANYYLNHYNNSQGYDFCSYLKGFSSTVDKFKLTQKLLLFEIPEAKIKRHSNTPRRFRDEELTEKELSKEALLAYGQITNAPANDNEEVLLRTIDLLVATGMRGNEVLRLPVDCLIHRTAKDHSGKILLDQNGNEIVTYGIKYFPEKGADTRVHWLAPVDTPFALRAINKLKELCQPQRELAKFQYDNPGRLFPLSEDYKISDEELLDYIPYSSKKKGNSSSRILSDRRGNLRKTFIKNLDINFCKIEERWTCPNAKVPAKYFFYKIKDIEKAIHDSPKFKNYKFNSIGLALDSGKVLLHTHELLILPVHGAHKLKSRKDNNIKFLLPR